MSDADSQEPRAKNPTELTFRDTDQLVRFVTDTGKILPRKYTGLTARQQRHVSRVVKQARSMLLLK